VQLRLGAYLEEPMPTDHKKMDKLRRGYREEIAILEAKCKDGNATREEQKQLAKIKKKLG
jgi:hypothetical protein